MQVMFLLILSRVSLTHYLATADGATPNRKFFRMCKPLQDNEDVVYRTINLYSTEKRFISIC